VGKVGALLLRVGDEGRYVPASVALRVVPTPPVTRVPGGPPELVGVALYEGVVVPVLAIGAARGDMVVCACDGELVALVGSDGFETGIFEASGEWPEVVEHAGLRFSALDVAGLYASVARTVGREPWASGP
jgi:hypothetical protein